LNCSTDAAHAATADDFKAAICRHLRYSLGIDLKQASPSDLFWATSLSVRELLIDGRIQTEERYRRAGAKRVYYLSMEFLIGRSLGKNLYNLGVVAPVTAALGELGADLDEIRACERDAGLGNGGLGRLAACFLDSLATLGMPGYGYGINYRYGLFRQEINNGYQREKLDNWLVNGNPWQIERREQACIIPVYGRIEHGRDMEGGYNPMWLDWEILIGVPHDMLMVGYGGSTVNTLRLYSARASDEFDMQIFNRGDYIRAVERKVASETVSKVLYPADDIEAGRELRLIQEYFFVACALRDIIRRYRQDHSDMADFGRKVAIQLNDTHPALAVAELMRTLVDEHQFPWEKAWQITRQTTAYTNHTLLSEALERWPVDLIERVLPRHMQIIFEINRRFLDRVQELRPGDDDRRARMSLIEEGAIKQVRMAHLALVGSHSVNGVAGLHSELVKSSLFPDFYDLWPDKFSNKTNGITPRRWLLKTNPELSGLISRHIGEAWITDLNRLRALEPLAGDAGFRADFDRIKARNKQRLARIIFETTRVRVDSQSLFDVQAKRIHEYKRQLLMVMGIIDRYLGIVDRGEFPETARTCVFAGKAAPGYAAAKLIIKLINNVAEVVNRDARVKGLLKVAFVPDYRVSLAEKIIPAADLSEQISTAGKEASGTGNMKFALNGALTVGTMDGANIEILEEVGRDNIFIFGLHADQVAEMRRGSYDPWEFYNGDARLCSVVDAIASDRFCAAEPGLFRPLWDSLLNGGDPYFHLADFAAYVQIQEVIDGCYRDRDSWIEKAVLNVARMGKFSSDRTIAQYAQDVWQIEPVPPTG